MTTPELIALAKKNPVVSICGVLSIGLAVAIYIRSGAIAEANATLDQKTAEAQRYELNIANATQLKEQYDTLVAANHAIESRLIRASDIGINQQFFYKLESDSGVKLVDLRQGARGAVAPKGGFAPVSFDVSLTGDFPHVMAFLRGLESGAHFCRVNVASCSGGRIGPLSLTLSLELLSQP